MPINAYMRDKALQCRMYPEAPSASQFSEKTKSSRMLYHEALRYTPYGVHSNWRIFDPYPLFMRRGRGSRIWDADGNEYIDFNMAFGALGVGHAHPRLVEELRNVIEEGTIYGFETERSVLLAKLITSRYGYDMVRFSTTGLEGTLLAVRLARAFTGRPKILKFEGCFHGSHEMVMVSVKPDIYRAGHQSSPLPVPASWGYPESLKEYTLVASYNDLDGVEKLMREYGNEVGGIILEPVAMNMGVVVPDIEFIKGLRELADEYNSLLIFDEVKTGGKMFRGVQDWCGVRADIIVVAKAIAGGYPLSAVLAGREIMETIGPKKTAHGGTFNSNILSVSAAYITLREILTEEALRRCQDLSDKLASGYSDILSDAGIKFNIATFANSGTVYFTDKRVRNWRDFVRLNDFGRWYSWVVAMVNHGVIPQALGYDEQWTISTQHSEQDIEDALEAMKKAVPEIRRGTPKISVEEVL
ncbi:Glutamate-1-semialdehyde 2,1-aminomutase [archaeon HR01]|nr:Glutamate-1-semialdehyde 2,1-aminomutase [archaeon HR01]